MPFLPPLPKDPDELQAYKETYQREIRQFRRQPGYIVGVLLALASALALVYLSSSTQRLFMITGMLGCSFIFDTITRHFTHILLRQQQQQRPPEQHPDSLSPAASPPRPAAPH